MGDDPEYDERKKSNTEVIGNPNVVGILAAWDLRCLSLEEIKKGIPKARAVEIKQVLDKPFRVKKIWK